MLLGEVAEFEMGQAPPGSECNADGLGTVFVKAGEFAADYPVQREWTTKPLKFGRRGDVFICVVGATAGKLNLGIDCAIGRSVAAIRPAPRLDTKFLYYQLQPWVLRLRGASAGSAQGVISKNQLAQVPIHVPALEEQRSVVAEIEKQFSRLDEAVANLQRTKANLVRYRQSVYLAALSGQVSDPAGRTSQSSGSLGTDDLPNGWHWAQLGELANVVRGGSPRPAGDPRFFGGAVPWITVGPLTADESDYLRSTPTGLTEAGRGRSRYVEPHTLLLTNSGATLGVPKITLIGGCINDGVAALLDLDYPLKRYLLIYLRSKTLDLRMVNQGAAQPNLNTTIIKSLRVPVPPVHLLQDIVDEVESRLSIVRGVEAQVEANLKRAQALRQAVLAKAFSSG